MQAGRAMKTSSTGAKITSPIEYLDVSTVP